MQVLLSVLIQIFVDIISRGPFDIHKSRGNIIRQIKLGQVFWGNFCFCQQSISHSQISKKKIHTYILLFLAPNSPQVLPYKVGDILIYKTYQY